MHKSGTLLLLALIMALAHWCPASPTKGLSIALISEGKNIVPGKPFTLGIHIKHEKGFHTYWKSPGAVGMATQLEWDLPEGFTASGISWPYPENSHMAEYPCHGYERDVTLLVEITPPKQIGTKSVDLKVNASWMCCATECFPGSKALSLSLPVSGKPERNPDAAKLIAKARKEIPQPDPSWKASILSKQGAPQINVLLVPPKNTQPKTLYLFSEDGQISSSEKQAFTYQADGSILITVPRSEWDDSNSKNLPLILKADAQYVSINPVYKNLH